MRISKLALIGIIFFGLITTLLSGGFYLLERGLMLHTVADGLNQTLFHLEGELQKALQSPHPEEAQAILDRTVVINDSIANISLSTDGRRINVSSSRALKGNLIQNDEYLPVLKLEEGLLDDRHLMFRSEFHYFVNAQKKDAHVLVRLDEEYVFGQLNELALFYGIGIFLILGLLSTLIFALGRRFLVQPLERVTRHAQEGSSQSEVYFIHEFSELDRTLRESFSSMRHQQLNLQEALDETRYLDGILRTVTDINQLLISAKGVDELMVKSINRLSEHPGYALCWLALEKEGRIEVHAFSTDPTRYLRVGTVMGYGVNINATDPVLRAFTQSESIAIDHLERHTSTAPWRFIAELGGYGSFIALPLLPSVHEKPTGVLGLYTYRSDGFDPKEIAMLEELAGDIGFAIRAFIQREQLEYHLTTDPITSLPNRVSLVDSLALDSDVVLAIINIDRFSEINEVYGITIGDGVLAGYAHWLSRVIQSHNGLSLYKMGSDEYVLLFSGWNDIERCREFLEQLIGMSAKEVFVVEEIEIELTITVGMAAQSERILEQATAALKQAKYEHQSIQLYGNTSSRRDQENNIAWYKRIKEAIEESRIVPYFQPIVDNKTAQIVKYEALIRLIDKDGSVIGPYSFLAIAKKTRLYGQLTKIMVEKTIERFKNSTIPVSLNLSTEDLLNTELADYIEATILEYGMGHAVIFEILESEGIENYTEVSAFVDRFKSIGCHFAIDDFGSGYSNFDHLLKLNIDTLKIDGSLIKNLPHDRNARIFVQHIRDFAFEMGINTVAEFVADEEIYAWVKEIGIDASQGYYFYEPSATLIEG